MYKIIPEVSDLVKAFACPFIYLNPFFLMMVFNCIFQKIHLITYALILKCHI